MINLQGFRDEILPKQWCDELFLMGQITIFISLIVIPIHTLICLPIYQSYYDEKQFIYYVTVLLFSSQCMHIIQNYDYEKQWKMKVKFAIQDILLPLYSWICLIKTCELTYTMALGGFILMCLQFTIHLLTFLQYSYLK